jgi:hypothetical protein
MTFIKSPFIPLFQRGRFPDIPLFGKEGLGEILLNTDSFVVNKLQTIRA